MKQLKYGIHAWINGVRNPEYRRLEFRAHKETATYKARAENRRQAARKWYRNNPERARRLGRESKKRLVAAGLGYRAHQYGSTPEIVNGMWKEQDGRCAICRRVMTRTRKSPEQAHIDHDHQTNRVRAILCRQCNHLIGNCRENVDILVAAIEYLEKHKRSLNV